MSFVYDKAREAFLGVASGSINWINDTIKATLVSSSYSPNQSSHQYVDPAITAHTGSWSTQTLTGKTATNGEAYAENVTFPSIPVGSTIDYLVIFKEAGIPGGQTACRLIALLDSAHITGLPLTGSGASVTVNFNTGPYKIFKL